MRFLREERQKPRGTLLSLAEGPGRGGRGAGSTIASHALLVLGQGGGLCKEEEPQRARPSKRSFPPGLAVSWEVQTPERAQRPGHDARGRTRGRAHTAGPRARDCAPSLGRLSHARKNVLPSVLERVRRWSAGVRGGLARAVPGREVTAPGSPPAGAAVTAAEAREPCGLRPPHESR